ncbi:MAG: DNA-binding response regulator [Gammaproteobacteria bacterium]|nr:MAG: DNA-binding response regulator [Gammaproteobacteria bacterium]
MIRLLIAEDQAMLLSTLASLLDLEADIAVLHRAKNGQDALTYLLDTTSEEIDILVTDIEMPELTGIELAQEISNRQLKVKTIILTTFARAGYLRRAMDAGVKGYLLKDSPSDELLTAIRKVAAGGRAIAPELMQESWMELDPLTDKERQALRLAKDGATTAQIAQKLHLTEGTIRNYLSSAASKLNAKNRIEAARIAHQNGWL